VIWIHALRAEDISSSTSSSISASRLSRLTCAAADRALEGWVVDRGVFGSFSFDSDGANIVGEVVRALVDVAVAPKVNPGDDMVAVDDGAGEDEPNTNDGEVDDVPIEMIPPDG
jgi:hypothetical protein